VASPWETLARCLAATDPGTLHQLNSALKRAYSCGALPFEIIAGAPFERYGARVTFQHPSPEILARAFNLDRHPWGAPDWVGLRIAANGPLRVKPYHRVDQVDARFELPPAWPTDLYPVMAALDGEITELYLRKRQACDFAGFARCCLGPLRVEPPATVPQPRPHDDSFCVSLRREGCRLCAISVFADWRALPRDPKIESAWSAGLNEADRLAYLLALAGARSLGFLPLGNWHAMLAWTVEADGARHRAVSLSVPPHTWVAPASAGAKGRGAPLH